MRERKGKEEDDDLGFDLGQMESSSLLPLTICLFALLVRVSVSLHSYSGEGDAPKYGDFEAQRHWMEITLNIPLKEWYRNGTNNDLNYWGLDYPPLTAYQSYVHGLFLRYFNPESVALFSSRGHESPLGKLLMRWTALSSDVLIFFPSTLYFVTIYCTGQNNKDKWWLLAMILLSPGLILVDHGHFQYNCISLGLTLGAVAAIFFKRELVSCILFSLALNHKQMSAYFAPAFFSHLLGKCLRRKYPFIEVIKLGLTVLGTFSLVWWPYLNSTEAIREVLFRLAPFERGLYEDYVANFWCSTSVLIKWKKLLTTEFLKLLTLGATVCAALPSMIQQLRSPTDKGFLYALFNSSFSFYLFSFQVHEKSILLPLLPASLLALDEPDLYGWFVYYALFSMFPLLCRDKLIVPYVALLALFSLLHCRGNRRNKKTSSSLGKALKCLGLVLSVILHVVYLTFLPPKKYPFLFEALIMALCFLQFVFFTVYSNLKQWNLLGHSTSMENQKKSL